jgi:hypothetical protein
VDIPENENKCHLNKTTDSGGGGERERVIFNNGNTRFHTNLF